MTDDPAFIKDLKAVSRSEPTMNDIEAIEKELYSSESDRAMVIASSCFIENTSCLIENTLEQLLASKMRKDLNSKDRKRLFEYEGAVGTFSSKIIVAYAMSIIGRITRDDLELIRLLRNEFAHARKPFGFDTPEVYAVCAKFQIPDFLDSASPVMVKRYKKAPDPEQPVTSGDYARDRFINACHNISYRLSVARRGFMAGDFVFRNDDPVP